MDDKEDLSHVMYLGRSALDKKAIKEAGPNGVLVYEVFNNSGTLVTVASFKCGTGELHSSIALGISTWEPCGHCIAYHDPYVTQGESGHWRRIEHPLWRDLGKMEQQNG